MSITEALNAWLTKYHLNTSVRGMEEDFYWYSTDNTISYSLLALPNNLIIWNQLLDELQLGYTTDPFYTCFLHEVGHANTYYDFDDDIIDDDEEIKLLITKEPEGFDRDVNDIYLHLPTELAATKWAVDFINTYPERVKELIHLVSPLIKEFINE